MRNPGRQHEGVAEKAERTDCSKEAAQQPIGMNRAVLSKEKRRLWMSLSGTREPRHVFQLDDMGGRISDVYQSLNGNTW